MTTSIPPHDRGRSDATGISPPRLARLLGCDWHRLELGMEGLRLFTSDGERSIDWQAIAQDGRLHRGWLFRRLSLPQHAAVLGWLPGWKRGFWRAFEARLQAHRQPLVESTLREIEAQLKSRYPRQSLWLGLSRQADEVLAPFEGSSPSAGEDPLVRRLRQIATADNSLLERYREHYIAQQQRAFGSLFARVERQPLTVAQQRACIIDDDRNLVLAGAGTGKTSTLIARVAYLVASRQAQPHEILLLAYGREAATEMQQRLQQRLGIPVTATTFHALGQRIIAAVEGARPAISTLASQNRALERWLEGHLEVMLRDPGYHQALSSQCLSPTEPPLPPGDSAARGRQVSFLAQLLRRYRSSGLEASDHPGLIDRSEEPARLEATLKLLMPLLNAYQAELEARGEIDFDAMIARALAYVEQGRYRPRWRFVLVDEFQDLSEPRARLIRALLNAVTGASLFAVGDDWQSIYRFNGSDIRLTTAFSDYFGDARCSALDLTFRFNNRINEVASGFVMRNPHQLRKTLATVRQQDEPALSLLRHSGDVDGALERVLDTIRCRAEAGSRVLILARHRFRLPDAARRQALEQRFPSLAFEIQTCHGAKGREADYVVLLGLDGGPWGFPSGQVEHPLLEALLPPGEDFEQAEERRLFYVALTRARQRVYLLGDASRLSPFVAELLRDRYPLELIG